MPALPEASVTRLLDDWLQAYLVYTSSSPSPEIYHKWAAISAIAGVLQRKVFFKINQYICYPNHYIILTGPPGMKKSATIRVVREVLDKIPDVNISTDSITREKLILNMSQKYKDGMSALTVHSSEFGSFFSSSGMEMMMFLIDIYDSQGEWSHDTKMGGKNKIQSPFLNLLAGTTPDWIAKGLPVDTNGVGLTSRSLFIYADKPRVKDFLSDENEDINKVGELLKSDLTRIATIAGKYNFDSRETYLSFNAWYREWIENNNPTNDHIMTPYFARKDIHMIKLCMVVAASRRQELLITKPDIDTAFALLAGVEEEMPKSFAGFGTNPLASPMDRMLNAITMCDSVGLSMEEITLAFRKDLRLPEIDELISMMMKAGMIQLNDKGRFVALPM